MRYFIADTHFNHNQPFIYEARGFDSVESHDKAILARINSEVGEEDELYILGDFALGSDLDYVRECLNAINCNRIHLILGNHDSLRKIEEVYSKSDKIVEICHATTIKTKKLIFYCSHFPTVMDMGDPQHMRYINVFGHTHQKFAFYHMNNTVNIHMYHVGVDMCGGPVSEEGILGYIAAATKLAKMGDMEILKWM